MLLWHSGQVVYFGEVDSAHGTLLAYMERHGVRPTPGQVLCAYDLVIVLTKSAV